MTAASMVLTASCALALASQAMGISLGQVDDFNDLTTQSWMEGGPSPNPPVNVSSGGPDGSAYVSNTSSGGAGPGSKQIMFNRDQWLGDYTSAGVTQISAMLRASSNGPALSMRLGLDGLGGRYITATPIALPNDDQWYPVVFDVSPTGLIGADGGIDPEGTLANVFELRLMTVAGIDFNGDSVATTLDVDNIRALPAPGGVILLGLASGILTARRRRG